MLYKFDCSFVVYWLFLKLFLISSCFKKFNLLHLGSLGSKSTLLISIKWLFSMQCVAIPEFFLLKKEVRFWHTLETYPHWTYKKRRLFHVPVWRRNHQVISDLMHYHYHSLLKKLDKLINSIRPVPITEISTPVTNTFTFYSRVANLSNTKFSNDEMSLLNKCLKYSPNIYNKKNINFD